MDSTFNLYSFCRFCATRVCGKLQSLLRAELSQNAPCHDASRLVTPVREKKQALSFQTVVLFDSKSSAFRRYPTISDDIAARKFVIEDSGIGMTHDELARFSELFGTQSDFRRRFAETHHEICCQERLRCGTVQDGSSMFRSGHEC